MYFCTPYSTHCLPQPQDPELEDLFAIYRSFWAKKSDGHEAGEAEAHATADAGLGAGPEEAGDVQEEGEEEPIDDDEYAAEEELCGADEPSDDEVDAFKDDDLGEKLGAVLVPAAVPAPVPPAPSLGKLELPSTTQPLDSTASSNADTIARAERLARIAMLRSPCSNRSN